MHHPFADLAPDAVLPLPAQPPAHERSAHQWSQEEIDALTLAHASRRPLLVRGEPGTGKTQIARAAAVHLGWMLHAVTIHPRFEPQDLLCRFDAVKRLADAQAKNLRADAAYWTPGPLWWAFGWDSACAFTGQTTLDTPPGHVILIDEIDKADSDLPNSLLEVLGQRTLRIDALGQHIGGADAALPLVLITTNEERELPAAFVRRCMVLNLAAPAGSSYRDWLVRRGQAHHGPKGDCPIDAEVLRRAADQMVADRNAVIDAGLPPPGPAEYLDLLAALHQLAPGDTQAQLDWLRKLSAFAFLKQAQLDDAPALSQQRKPVGTDGSA